MKLSIITINYNNVEGLKRTIKSVIGQTFNDFEYIIIDGGSTDGSKNIIDSYKEYISYWVSEPDKGVYNAMNKGILQAKGEYIIFMNSGDTLFAPSVLENVFSEKTDAGIIYGDFHVIYPDKKIEPVRLPDTISMPFLFRKTICHQAAFIKKELFDEYGLYREDLKIVSDWAFFLKVLFFDRTSHIRVPVVISNYYMDGMSSQEENIRVTMDERERILTEEFYTELSDAYHTFNEYRLFYNKPIFVRIRNLKNKIKQILKK